jgi:hypothetical protein
VAFRRRDEIEGSEGVDVARLAKQGASSAVYTLVVLAAVAVAIGLSMRVRAEWDWSSGGNALSPLTVQTVRGLDQEVHLYALFTDEMRQAQRKEAYWHLLRRFRALSPKLEVEFIDPVTRPGRVKELGLDPQQRDVKVEGVTVGRRGERRIVFEGTSEQDVTNALLELKSSRPRVVGFLRGYGEKDPASSAPGGMASLASALRGEYYTVVDVGLADGIPPEVAVLVAGGPLQPIPPPELDALSAWLAGGGRLLALLDAESSSGLEAVLEPWGLRPTGVRVLDPRQNVNSSREFVKVTEYGRHPIVSDFNAAWPTAFPAAGAVEGFEPGDPLLFQDSLARSSRFSIGLDADGTPRQGPFVLAAASWKRHSAPAPERTQDRQEKETRVVLVGDSDFASNLYLPASSNRNFVLNCIGWLSRAQELVALRSSQGQTFSIESREMGGILGTAFAAPLLVVLAGVVTFLRRRGR